MIDIVCADFGETQKNATVGVPLRWFNDMARESR